VGYRFRLFMYDVGTFHCLGFLWDQYWTMLIARFFFWVALYGMLLAQNMLVYSIFSQESVAFAYSLVIFAMRAGGVAAYFLSGIMLQNLKVAGTLWLAWFLVVFAFLGTLVFGCLFRGTNTARAVRRLHPSGRGGAKTFKLSLLRTVPSSCWMFTLAIMCLYAGIFPFEATGVDMLVSDFGFNPTSAGYLLSTIPALSLLGPLITPFLGQNLDGLTRSATYGLGLMVCGYAILSLQASWAPYPGFLLNGLGYVTSVCALWGSLPMLVSTSVEKENAKNVESLVLGLSYAALSVGQFFSNFITGVINDMASYQLVCVWYTLLSAFGVLCVVLQGRWYTPLQHVEEGANSGELTTAENQQSATGDEAEADSSVVVFETDQRRELSHAIDEDHYVAS